MWLHHKDVLFGLAGHNVLAQFFFYDVLSARTDKEVTQFDEGFFAGL